MPSACRLSHTLDRMKTLFHVSEQSGIERFEPRMPPTANADVKSPVVWAVDQPHLANYLLPRECPRVAFHFLPSSSEQDCERFFGSGGTRHVVAIESSWLERATNCILWLYEFSPEPFLCADATAGYFVSLAAITPVSRRRIERPLIELVACGAELRVMPSLFALAASVTSSSLAFSCIRMRNASVSPDAL